MDPTPLADPSLWSQFGSFAIVFVVMVTLGGGAIVWLIRDRARVITQRDALFAQLLAASSQATATVAAVGPILEATNLELRLARERDR